MTITNSVPAKVKIAAWRAEHVSARVTEAVLCDLLGTANLRGADLRGADLWGANLWGANLSGAMPISTPSGSGYLVPTAEGWRITIGCWRDKTLDDLRALVAGDDWPESTGAERERRRPIMAGLLALCEAHVVYHRAVVPALAAKWGEVK